MSYKFKIILLSLALIITGLFLYVSYRVPVLEKKHTARLISETNRIVKYFKNFRHKSAEKKQKIELQDLKKFINQINEKEKMIALMAIADTEGKRRCAIKNSRFIKTSELFDAILNDFTQNKFSVSKETPFLIRYYDDRAEKKIEQKKFYIFLTQIADFRVLIAYPGSPGKSSIMRMICEMALLCALIVLIFTTIYIRHQKGAPSFQEASTVKQSEDTRSPSPTLIKKENVMNEVNAGSEGTLKGASDTLNDAVIRLFKELRKEFTTSTIALYTASIPGILTKTHELKGESFIRIDSETYDTIDIDNPFGDELKKSSVMVLDGGKKILFPLIYNSSFAGILRLNGERPFTGPEITDIKNKVKKITKITRDFLLVNDVMVERTSGLHSKTFFNIKLNENLKPQERGPLSLIFISLFHETEIPSGDRGRILKLIAPEIEDTIKDTHDITLCRYDDNIALIIPNTHHDEAAACAYKLKQTISRFRIKTRPGTTVTLPCRTGIASSDRGPDPEKIIREAEVSLQRSIASETDTFVA